MEYEIVTGTGVHALAHLAEVTCDPDSTVEPLREALATIGDATGETWRHLYGLCLDGDHSFEQLVLTIDRMDARALRRVLLGGSAWSWVHVVGAATLDAAVDGDPDAAAELLAHDRYYAGSAADALGTVLSWDAPETKERFLRALDAYREVHREGLIAVAPDLARAEREAVERFDTIGAREAIAALTGYTYVPEPEADRVVLALHVHDDSLVLAQHESARLIVYGRRVEPDAVRRLVEVSSALGDETRVRLLAAIAGGADTVGALLAPTDLSRSTIHHHLSILRRVGLVQVEGNARSYRYHLTDDSAERLADALRRVVHPSEEANP